MVKSKTFKEEIIILPNLFRKGKKERTFPNPFYPASIILRPKS